MGTLQDHAVACCRLSGSHCGVDDCAAWWCLPIQKVLWISEQDAPRDLGMATVKRVGVLQDLFLLSKTPVVLRVRIDVDMVLDTWCFTWVRSYPHNNEASIVVALVPPRWFSSPSAVSSLIAATRIAAS